MTIFCSGLGAKNLDQEAQRWREFKHCQDKTCADHVKLCLTRNVKIYKNGESTDRACNL
jgi:hypothetical protein